MTRNEFLDGLRRALAGKVDVEIIDETIRYYEDYIDIQIRSGKTEQEILEQLGKPQLLAKSIVNANRDSGERGNGSAAEEIYEGEEEPRYSRSRMGDKGVRMIMKMPGWMAAFLALLLLFLFLWFIVSVLSFLAPVLIPVAIVLVIIAISRRR